MYTHAPAFPDIPLPEGMVQDLGTDAGSDWKGRWNQGNEGSEGQPLETVQSMWPRLRSAPSTYQAPLPLHKFEVSHQ